jgi:hypothetical protein
VQEICNCVRPDKFSEQQSDDEPDTRTIRRAVRLRRCPALHSATNLRPGTCNIELSQTQEGFLVLTSNFSWDGRIINNAGKVIDGYNPEKVIISSTKNYVMHCALLKNDLSVRIIQYDSLEFKIGTQTWKTEDKNCKIDDWTQDGEIPVSDMEFSIQAFAGMLYRHDS